MRWIVFSVIALAFVVNVSELCRSDAATAQADQRRPPLPPRVAKMLALFFQLATLLWIWSLSCDR